MASKDVRIIIKALADMTGLSRAATALHQWAERHKVLVAGMRATWHGLGAAASASFAAISRAGSVAAAGVSSALRGMRNVAIGTVGALAASTREFVTWNTEAARAWTMMDTGVGEFVRLRREVAGLAGELGVAKSELGKGWYQALSKGVSEDQLIPFLRLAGKVAVADGTNVINIVDGLTTVLNAFGLQSGDAAKVADQMFQTVRKGGTTFAEMASYIAQAAPAAAGMGVELDQLLAATSTLTKQGLPTATAMVQIRNAILGLNGEMGDGWAKTMTLQDALESFAESVGYSDIAIEKAFGKENVTGVLALTGKNAKLAQADLLHYRDAVGVVDAAYAKVNSQIGHWPRLWQSFRTLVSDVGEQVDTVLRPAIDDIAARLQKLRDSGGFSGLLNTLAATVSGLLNTLAATVSEVVTRLVAGVQTAVDVLSKATLGGVISSAVGALIDMAVTLLAEGLRGLGTVMVALAKIFSAALAQDFMKMDLPFRDEEKEARRAALRKLIRLSPEQAAAFGVPEEFTRPAPKMSHEQLRDRQRRMQEWAGGLSLDQAAQIATASRDADIEAALANAARNFAASRGRMESAGGRIVGNIAGRTGVDVRAVWGSNIADARAMMGAAGGSPAAGAGTATRPAPAPAGGGQTVKNATSGALTDEAARQLMQEFAEINGLMHNVFHNMMREAGRLRQTVADAEARSRQPGG